MKVGGFIMSILDNMRQVKNELFDRKHPLVNEQMQLRETYAIGYAMLVCVNGHPSELAKNDLKKQFVLLNLPLELMKQLIQVALQAEVEIIHNVLQMLGEPQHKYIFMLDLYAYAQKDHKITEKEQELLVLFEELLQLSYSEIQFIRGFRLAMLRNDIDLAVKVVQSAFEQKVAVPLDALSHFLPQFMYQERWGQMTLLNGQKRVLSYAIVLTGELVIGQGAELDLNGMEVTFAQGASIVIDGGVLKADGAKFVATMDADRTLLSVRNVSQLKIVNARFVGANNVRAIEMNSTKVELENCLFEKCFHEERGGAIYFANSDYLVMKNCTFMHNSTMGKGGCMYIAGTEASHMKAREFFSRVTGKVQRVNLVMENCRFEESRAQIGGALYMYDADIRMTQTVFESCKSSKGGAALDTLNCRLTASNNHFENCQATADEAVIVIGGEKFEGGVIGTFKQCSPRDVLVK